MRLWPSEPPSFYALVSQYRFRHVGDGIVQECYVRECSRQDPALVRLLALSDREFIRRYPERKGQRLVRCCPPASNSSWPTAALQALAAVACKGPCSHFVEDCYEVKRLFVVIPEARGTGVTDVPDAVHRISCCEERWQRTMYFETGTRQPEAIHVVLRHGYTRIRPYPPYPDDPLALCFAKTVHARIDTGRE